MMEDPLLLNIVDKLACAPVVPTVLPISVDILARYIQVLHEEDYPALEVLCRPAEDAVDLVKEINSRPERGLIALGMGTVTSERTARLASELRPDFLVSPAFSRSVLSVAVEAGIPYIPAVEGFQDVQDVLDAFGEHGLAVELLKLCPVINIGQDYIRMLCNCFPGIRFCPTGDPKLESLQTFVEWKRRPGIAAPMSAAFVPRKMLIDGDFDAVRQRLRHLRSLSNQAAEA
jgi:2-dehydro-3-deoxyphosphogluconate aldolase/(4S)-4-hydroxy-2-oxoglutarate aldolase